MIDLTSQFPKLRVIEVQKVSFCGVACLADSVRYLLNKDITQDEIGDYLQIDPEVGTPHHKMLAGAKHFGLEAKETFDPNMSLTDLAKELENPNTRIILNIMLARDPSEGGTVEEERDGGHYVIFEGLVNLKEGVHAIYNDPSFPSAIQFVKLAQAEAKWYDYVPQLNHEKIAHWALILTKPE